MSELPVIRQAFRFALAPTSMQDEFLSGCAGASRFWFNQGLCLVKERLKARETGEAVRVPWSYKDLCSEFRGAEVKDGLAPWRGEVVTGSYQAGLEACGRALQNFSKGRKAGRNVGFPRFRAKGRSQESIIFQRPRITDARHVLLDGRLGPIRSKESMRKLTLRTRVHLRRRGLRARSGPRCERGHEPRQHGRRARAGRRSTASFSPNPGRQGDTFTLSVSGFAPGATVQIALTRPDGTPESYSFSMGSDGAGSYSFGQTSSDVLTGTYEATVSNPETVASTRASVQVNPG